MRLLRILLCLSLAGALALTACSQRQARQIGRSMSRPSEHSTRSHFVEANYRAADIMAEALENALEEGDDIVITDFVNLADPNMAATLGKIIPEQISSRLAQHGFEPVSQRHADAGSAQAQATGHARLVGSYTTTSDRLFINARVIRMNDLAVLAGYDYELPASSSLRTLVPGVWGEAGIEPTVKTSFTTAARR